MSSLPLCWSLWQPWATFVAAGEKQWETRAYPVHYRGDVVIHAAKTTKELDYLLGQLYPEPGLALWDDKSNEYLTQTAAILREHGITADTASAYFPLGAALAVVTISDCKRTQEVSPTISERERALGDYTPGRFAIRLDNVRRFPPVPMRGFQRFFGWPRDIPFPTL